MCKHGRPEVRASHRTDRRLNRAPPLWVNLFAGSGNQWSTISASAPRAIHSGIHTIKTATHDMHGYVYRFAGIDITTRDRK